MAIEFIVAGVDDGASARTKINQAIVEANKVVGKADQTALTAEANARQTADNNLQSQITQRATLVALSGEISARQQADQQEALARQEADQAETDARVAGDNARATYAEVASEPTRPGEANRFFTADLVGDPATITPLPDDWKVVGQNGAVIAIPGAGKVAPLAVRRVEPQRQYRVRAVVQRATNTEDPANDAIRIGLQWLDRNKADAGRTICVDLVDITTANGRLGYFFNFATADADNIDFTAPAGAVYVRPFVQTFGSGITHVEVIEIVDLSDTVEFSPDVSEWMRQLAGFNWRLEDATTRLGVAEENIEASHNASWFTEGTLNDARLSGNVLFRNKEQTVTAAKTFLAELRMQDAILIGDGEVENPGDAEAPTATARILGDGDHLSIAPTDKAGGYNTLRELTFSHIYNVWLVEGGFRTTGTFVATEDGQIGRDLSVGRDATVSGDLDVAGSAQIAGDLGVVEDLGVLGNLAVYGGHISPPLGTAALPGIAPESDLDTGIYFPAANQMGFATGGTVRALLSTTEWQINVTISGTTVQSGGYDTTSGRLARVQAGGYFGYGGSQPNALSTAGALDAIDRSSIYRVSSANVVTVNGPAGAGGGVVLTTTFDASNAVQVYCEVSANARIWWRTKTAGVWGGYQRHLSAAEIGSSVQGYDADLAAIAALTTTAYGRGLLTLSGAPALRAQVNTYGVINTDADATLTVGTDAERIRHTATLTADRAITLATAGVAAGAVFRITRTGGGAFNLNVGTGPLKALATNTWATFVYDGAAWYLAEYGAL